MNEKAMNIEKHKNKKPEILAPAGTREALEAAVKAGADAVYAGGSFFSARAYAGNFDRQALIDAIKFCHFYGVKFYMTVNTLFKENEILGQNKESGLKAYMTPFCEAGVDAVIVQDVGAARLLKKAFPNLMLHASTQMSITSSYGMRLLKETGFTRVVPARELSLNEIRSIKEEVDIEIETFIHGAMCFAYSGKCLFSGFAGGRSGNRGRCAQPCRKCYAGYAKNEKGYIMSLKDMCTLEILPQMVDAGIDSFKIEGRMKNPTYVAATVQAYRQALDHYEKIKAQSRNSNMSQSRNASWNTMTEKDHAAYASIIPGLVDNMKDIYNRGGFSTGYFETEKGPQMTAIKRPNHQGLKIGVIEKIAPPEIFIRTDKEIHAQDVFEIHGDVELTSTESAATGKLIKIKGKDFKKLRVGDEVHRTRNNSLIEEINKKIIQPEKQIEAAAEIEAAVGEPLRITIFDFSEESRLPNYERITRITVTGPIVETAAKAATSADSLKEKMQKTGGTGVAMKSVECRIDGNGFVQMSAFNNLRREAIEEYKAAKIAEFENGRK